MTEPSASTRADRLAVGTKVEVRSGFDGSWSTGFAVEEVLEAGYRLRRRSDGQVLPATLPSASVRKERKSSMWWV
ncbi:hypothetical protein KSP35_08830 [Aquihabitans sp. G128]|uniref:hypothetical protein n=1 Tax=Aquihabitans sp. G128 TaxID=2849779 RepID=UPI001C23B059|nr:hypothetical protein [Aquihabitans sp. G128]QXC62867.1 hypothetical protein KSP35_08830 [Aquihabitans sp. G128]